MKILFLNTWHGTLRDALLEFIKAHVADTDIFCFQEASEPVQNLCADVLKGFHVLLANSYEHEHGRYNQAIYVRKDIDIVASDVLFVGEPNTGLAAYVQLQRGLEQVHLCNVHGTSRPTDKRDTPGRYRFTRGVVEYLQDKKGAKIVGGDINVFPENKCLQVFETNGYRDLIRGYGVTNTRNHYVWDRYPQNPRQYYSDYAFVSSDVRVNSFTVPDVEVSDHLPLLLDFSV